MKFAQVDRVEGTALLVLKEEGNLLFSKEVNSNLSTTWFSRPTIEELAKKHMDSDSYREFIAELTNIEMLLVHGYALKDLIKEDEYSY